MVAKDAVAEVRDHERESLAERDLGLPVEQLLGAGDVGLALVRVVLRVGSELDACVGIDGLLHHLGQLQHGELPWVSQVERTHVLPFHQSYQPFHLHPVVMERQHQTMHQLILPKML